MVGIFPHRATVVRRHLTIENREEELAEPKALTPKKARRAVSRTTRRTPARE